MHFVVRASQLTKEADEVEEDDESTQPVPDPNQATNDYNRELEQAQQGVRQALMANVRARAAVKAAEPEGTGRGSRSP